MRSLRIYFCIVFVVVALCSFVQETSFLHANMNSDSYMIQYNNINMGSGTQTKDGSYTVTQTSGQTAPGEYFTANGYYVKAGFQYMYSIGTFSFFLSNVSVNLGELTPSSFSTGSMTITVSAKGAGGYTVAVLENKPLTLTDDSTTIPDTLCDSTCSESTAAVWSNAANPGFGYTMSGTDISSDFIDTTYFKQFANMASFEQAQSIMSNAGVVSSSQADMTLKVSITGSQAAGNYQNMLTFIATPGY